MDYSKLTNAELDKLIAEKRNAKIFCDCGKEHCWNDIREDSRDEFLSEYRPTTDPRYAMELLLELPTAKRMMAVSAPPEKILRAICTEWMADNE